MHDKERDHYDRLIAEQREKQDRLEQEQRDRRDRQKALIDDLSDAYKDYRDAERDENFLGMAKAKERIDEAKKQLEAMNSK
jgi:hypothetical protein